MCVYQITSNGSFEGFITGEIFSPTAASGAVWRTNDNELSNWPTNSA